MVICKVKYFYTYDPLMNLSNKKIKVYIYYLLIKLFSPENCDYPTWLIITLSNDWLYVRMMTIQLLTL